MKKFFMIAFFAFVFMGICSQSALAQYYPPAVGPCQNAGEVMAPDGNCVPQAMVNAYTEWLMGQLPVVQSGMPTGLSVTIQAVGVTVYLIVGGVVIYCFSDSSMWSNVQAAFAAIRSYCSTHPCFPIGSTPMY